ncbi:MAG TPA: AAA family ATPase [Candidatus Saccharimonadales bacterium]|nr:AAA family ATPase [Candidatus Saccharimonadales bacterium]
MDKLWIIGISGTNGAGKDTVGQMLADQHGYLFISITELLRSEAKRRGLPVEREILRTISAEWRRELGLGVLVDKAVAEYEVQRAKYPSGVVLASIRNPGEADRIHELGGTLIWVDADPKVRYERVQANKQARGRSGEDDKTFEQFMAEEAAEMQSLGGDAATLNMAAVKEKCDFVIENSHENLTVFRSHVERTLGL